MTTPSAGARIKQQILEQAFPDSLFNSPNANFDQLEQDLNAKVDSISSTASTAQLPKLPSINLIPEIPTIDIPSPAEIRQFINKKIEEKKRQLQEQLLKKVLEEARLEDMPFTARRELINRVTKRTSRR